MILDLTCWAGNMSNLVFNFPMLEDSKRNEVERKYCELVRDYRNGIRLAPEAIDWMDAANLHLSGCFSSATINMPRHWPFST